MNIIYRFKRHRAIKKYGAEKVAMAELRAELRLWGYDTSHMTDEDIAGGVNNFTKALADFGMSAKEAASRLNHYAK